MMAVLGHGHSHGGGGHGHSHGGGGHGYNDHHSDEHHDHQGDEHHDHHGDEHHDHQGDEDEHHDHHHGDEHHDHQGDEHHDHHGHSHGKAKNSHGRRDVRKLAQNINVRAAFIHVIGDLIQSVGVVIAGYIIKFQVGH